MHAYQFCCMFVIGPLFLYAVLNQNDNNSIIMYQSFPKNRSDGDLDKLREVTSRSLRIFTLMEIKPGWRAR